MGYMHVGFKQGKGGMVRGTDMNYPVGACSVERYRMEHMSMGLGGGGRVGGGCVVVGTSSGLIIHSQRE